MLAVVAAPATVAATVRRAAFTRLRSGNAVSQSTLALDTGLSSSAVRTALGELVSTGQANLDARHHVVAVGGLSVVPAAHGLFMDGSAFWTWCAFDAIGVPAALGLDAVARTRCGHCAAPIDVILTAGTPRSDSAIVGWLPGRPCTNVQEDFCPEANLFCNEAHLGAWQADAGAPSGVALSRAGLAARGTQVWAEMRSAPEDPRGAAGRP